MQVEVRFSPSGRALRVGAGTTLLEAARRAGLPVASACGAEGICGRCGVRVLLGAEGLSPETEREAHVKRLNRVEAGLRLACRARVSGPVEVTAGYW
jgi:2Fe-2S ferredoxin